VSFSLPADGQFETLFLSCFGTEQDFEFFFIQVVFFISFSSLLIHSNNNATDAPIPAMRLRIPAVRCEESCELGVSAYGGDGCGGIGGGGYAG